MANTTSVRVSWSTGTPCRSCGSTVTYLTQDLAPACHNCGGDPLRAQSPVGVEDIGEDGEAWVARAMIGSHVIAQIGDLEFWQQYGTRLHDSSTSYQYREDWWFAPATNGAGDYALCKAEDEPLPVLIRGTLVTL